MGRHIKPDARRAEVKVRLIHGERALLEARALRDGISMAEVMRRALMLLLANDSKGKICTGRVR